MSSGEAKRVSQRQKVYEDGCRKISAELGEQVRRLPMPDSLLALANLSDLFNCIRTAYNNGRADERKESDD